MTKHGFVYVTTCVVNDKKYIGKCQYNRKNSWKTYLGSGKKLKEDIIKYGKENFYREIIVEADSEDELCRLEEYYIEKCNAVNSSQYYNLKPSSIGGDTFNFTEDKERTRELKSKSLSGTKNPMCNREKTEKFKKAISERNSKGMYVDGVYFKNLKSALEHYQIDYNEFRRVSFQKTHEIIKPNSCKTNRVLDKVGKAVIIFGEEYKNKREACLKLHMNNNTLKNKLDDPNNHDFVYK